MLYDKRLRRIQILRCPVYTSENERELRTIDTMRGIHRYYRLSGLDDLEEYRDIYIDEEMLKIIVRVVMSITRADTKDSDFEALSFILDKSEGFLPTFAIGRKGRFCPYDLGPELDDFE